MDPVDAGEAPLIDWGVAVRAFPGEARSGDLHVVEHFPGGVLVAAMDGLGHGDEAAEAAQIAADILVRNAAEPPVSLIQRCHEALRTTRGVAMSLASLAQGGDTMAWLGVGNVEASLLRSDGTPAFLRESLLLRGGVVGYRLPRLQSTTVSVKPGDTLVLATDGIAGSFLEGLPVAKPPAQIARDILARFARGTDDALVLVARYRGEAP
jgi:negative regulator of sigma-B (phosphoserine phosphatase)